ncbi:hypothetical protein FBZ93_1294 [Bradyrhizobium macuxiense]|uniref:Uncharacterized protein n=1 Tax=Bradyrhizobium macuxiense TaxID=1755647 RepID=A0A560KVF7_9BRAD|nr:hypothetical protein FBZ93_1294 [Bradyrhizobium macuxiense]
MPSDPRTDHDKKIDVPIELLDSGRARPVERSNIEGVFVRDDAMASPTRDHPKAKFKESLDLCTRVLGPAANPKHRFFG